MQEQDYGEWKQKQLWTLIEASCLLAGLEPARPPAKFDTDSRMGREAARIYADLKDAIDLKQIGFVESRDRFIRGRRVKPRELIAWAVGHGYEIPSNFRDLMNHAATETPQERRVRLAQLVAEEKLNGNRSFLRTVAEKEGISASRLKQILYSNQTKAEQKNRQGSAWLAPLAASRSKSTSPGQEEDD